MLHSLELLELTRISSTSWLGPRASRARARTRARRASGASQEEPREEGPRWRRRLGVGDEPRRGAREDFLEFHDFLLGRMFTMIFLRKPGSREVLGGPRRSSEVLGSRRNSSVASSGCCVESLRARRSQGPG